MNALKIGIYCIWAFVIMLLLIIGLDLISSASDIAVVLGVLSISIIPACGYLMVKISNCIK